MTFSKFEHENMINREASDVILKDENLGKFTIMIHHGRLLNVMMT